jgi:hypothetical protein
MDRIIPASWPFRAHPLERRRPLTGSGRRRRHPLLPLSRNRAGLISKIPAGYGPDQAHNPEIMRGLPRSKS